MIFVFPAFTLRPFFSIQESALANPLPSSMSSELFTIYDKCLLRVADRFIPEHTACSKVRPLSPWFDADCRTIKQNGRQLERRYRRTMSVEDRVERIKAVRQKHVDFLEKKNNYWSTRLSSESRTPSKLWKSMAKIHLDATDVKIYTPVSNFTFVSKVVERLVSGRLVSYLLENNLMPVDSQRIGKIIQPSQCCSGSSQTFSTPWTNKM